MIPYEEALEAVLARVEALGSTRVRIGDALGLVTAQDVQALEAVPPFDNSAVDGFAVRSQDVPNAGVELEVIETIPAGVAPECTIGAGQCARIMTGAVFPPGADAVVMVEDSTMLGATRVRIEASTEPGRHIRRLGDDLDVGAVALRAGTVIRPAHVGLLATVGRSEVAVHRRPLVGVISTGDELVGPEVELQAGQIRDSNRQMLLALCARAGFDTVDLGLVADVESDIELALVQGAQRCDALVTSGGVSMGDYDYVKAVLGRVGDMDWMQVAIKPAKPFAFGTIGSTPVFGLPGNPVSSLVSFELLAKPGLNAMAGHPEPLPRWFRAVTPEGFERKADGKTHFVRVLLESSDAGLVVRSTGAQGSHQLAASADADALAAVPDGDGVPAGGTVSIMVL